MKKIIPIFMIVASLAVFSCGNKGAKKPIVNGTEFVGDSVAGNGVYYNYKNSILISEAPMVNHKIEGTVKKYYDEGNISNTSEYKNGELNGLYTEYYKTGEKYKEVPYTNNKIDGVKKQWEKNGTLLYEAPYKEGNAIKGIKEYTNTGVEIPHPKIVITKTKIGYKLTLSDGNKNVGFYLVDSKGEMKPAHMEDGAGSVTTIGNNIVRAFYVTKYDNQAVIDNK